MKTSALLFAATAVLPLASANPAYPTDGGFNENVLSCRNANFKDCKTISLIHKLDTCINVPEPDGGKYGDMYSSFQVNGRMACRLYHTKADKNCFEPSVEPNTGVTGKNNQRATDWIVYPGITSWAGRWKFRSFKCTSLEGKTVAQLPKAVVADCAYDMSVNYSCQGNVAQP